MVGNITELYDISNGMVRYKYNLVIYREYMKKAEFIVSFTMFHCVSLCFTS